MKRSPNTINNSSWGACTCVGICQTPAEEAATLLFSIYQRASCFIPALTFSYSHNLERAVILPQVREALSAKDQVQSLVRKQIPHQAAARQECIWRAKKKSYSER